MKKILPYILVFCLMGGVIAAQDSLPDRRLALRELVSRADNNDPKALYELAKLHDIGYDTIEVDSARSTALYLKAARQGYAPAQNYLGFRYFTGQSVEKDTDSALYWIRKAADAGDFTAAANLAFLLSQNPSLALDSDEKIKWMTIAAEGGIIPAQENIVEIKRDEWMSLPSDSALILGLKYYNDKAPVMAIPLFESAASKGNLQALALLGDAYTLGKGVPYDYHKSLEKLYQSASQGYAPAQFILAELLEILPDALNFLKSSEISPQGDIFTAQDWIEKARNAGIDDAETAYSLLYAFPNSDKNR